MAYRACGWFSDWVRGRWSVEARTARKRSRTWMAVRAGGDQAVASRSKAWSVWGRYTPVTGTPACSSRRCRCRMAATGAISSCSAVDQQAWEGSPGGRGGAGTAGRSGRAAGWGSRRPASRAGWPAPWLQPQSAGVGAEQARHPRWRRGVPVGLRVIGPADLVLAGVVVVGGQVGLPVQRDDPTDRRVGAGQLGRGQGRVVGGVGGQQRQMAAGRPAGEHDPVALDLEVGGVVLTQASARLASATIPGRSVSGNSR